MIKTTFGPTCTSDYLGGGKGGGVQTPPPLDPRMHEHLKLLIVIIYKFCS